MIGLTLAFLVISVGAFLLLWIFRVRSKKTLFAVPICILCLPFIIGMSLYVLRTPIQQGKFLSDIAPLLSWVFPAEDLYDALAEKPLSDVKNTYIFKVSHKYVGKHAILIEIPAKDPPGWETEESLRLSVKITQGSRALFEDRSDRGYPYRGKDKYGYFYIGYKVGENVPVSEEVTVKINVDRRVEKFLYLHRNAKIIVRKISDE